MVPPAMLPVSLGPGGVVGAVVVPPYQVMRQLPAWAAVVLEPVVHGSCDVLAISIPVSKPAWLVIYGYSRIVRHIATVNMDLAALASAMKRGMVKVLEAAAPALAVNAGGV